MATLIVGCGYLGRRVGRLLSARGERVFGTCRSEARAAGLPAWGVEPLAADVLDADSLAGLPTAGKVVYCVGFDRSSGVPPRTVYVEGLRSCLAALGRPVERIVYASSTGVYGGDDGGWVDEGTPTDPRTESGRACLEAEGLLRECDPSAVVLRLAGLYGPGRVIGREKLERGEPIAGDPGKFLNLVHIDDAAAAVAAALERAEGGGTYLVADDRPVERREYYGLAARLIGAPEPRFEPPPSGVPEGANRRVSNARIRRELVWSPAFPDITTGLPAALAAES